MATESEFVPQSFKVWARDNFVYGPVDRATLEQWAEQQRVQADTWVYSASENAWKQGREILELFRFFHSGAPAAVPSEQADTVAEYTMEELRQFNLFSALSNIQVEQFIRFCRYLVCQPGQMLIRKGDPADGVFFLLSGKLRARVVVGMQDITVASIVTGDFFGEVAMLNQSARTADVVVESEARLMLLSAESFQLILQEFPALAGSILYAIAQVTARRLVESTQLLQSEIRGTFLWR